VSTRGATSAASQDVSLASFADKLQHEGAFKASDFSLSKEPGLEARIADSEALAKALGAAADGVELLIARAIEVTEQRCRHELQQAVDAATASAIRTTEQRMMGEREKAVEQAVGETRSEANSKQTAAVRKAIQDTETRCAEEQRVAVQLAKSAVNLEWGKTQEDVAAENAAKSFEQAARAATSALSAAQGLQMRDVKPGPSNPARPAPQPAAKPAAAAPKVHESLEFF